MVSTGTLNNGKTSGAWRLFTISFITLQTAFWVAVQHTSGELCRALSYASVLLALSYAIAAYFKEARGLITVAALIFTALADYCLVVLDEPPRVLAMLFFSVTQLCYAVRIAAGTGKIKTHAVIRLAAVAAFELAMLGVLRTSADALSAVTMFYFANLAVSLFLTIAKRAEALLFAGLLFFILCDVFVGLDVLLSDYITSSEGSLLYRLTHTGINVVWLFYIPSQTLIALSVAGRGNHLSIGDLIQTLE